jgi:molybdate transport system regulatory protein
LQQAASGTQNANLVDASVRQSSNRNNRDHAMKISARNVLSAKVISVTPGAVNSEVEVELSGGQRMVSVITNAAAKTLQLQPGKPVYAIVKASSVMLGVD